MTSGEVAGLFGVDRKTVTRWAAAGKLTVIWTAGGHRRYKAAEVRALLAPAAQSWAAARRPAVHSPAPSLGPLESAIMNAIWDAGQPLTVRAARDRLDYRTSGGDGDHPAYSTIMTVMVNLCRKGMLTRAVHERNRKRRAWWYEARVTREDHLAAVIRDVLHCAPDPAAVLRRAFPALVLPSGVPRSAAPPAASAPERPPARARQSVSTSAARARTRALRLLAREHYAEYAGIYEQVRPAAPDRYQARNRARMQLCYRYPDRYLELHAREQAAPGTDVPAGVRSKSWQRATARLADLRAPALPGAVRPVPGPGHEPAGCLDRAMAILREADSDLFTRMLTEEYQLWLAVGAAGTPHASARGARTRGGAGTGSPPGAVGVQAAGQELARLTAQLTEREMHVLDALCAPGASQQASGGAPAARQIAAGLSVAEATVRQHLLHLYRKLDVPPGPERRARLACKAVALCLAPPGASPPASLTAPHPEPRPARRTGTGPQEDPREQPRNAGQPP